MVTHAFKPITQDTDRRISEFKMNLVNKASARTAEDTQKNHAPKINNESYTKTGSNKTSENYRKKLQKHQRLKHNTYKKHQFKLHWKPKKALHFLIATWKQLPNENYVCSKIILWKSRRWLSVCVNCCEPEISRGESRGNRKLKDPSHLSLKEK